MTSRDDLIEEAAKAMCERAGEEEWEDCPQDWYRADAEAALAVFEQAHAPTDDERAVLAGVLRDNVIAAGGGRAFEAADKILAAGFRRTVQGEPSVTVATKPAIDEVRKVLDYYADEIDVSIWQEIASAVDDIPDCETWTAAPHAEHVQGEPTDAQVEAALVAYWGAMNVAEYGSRTGMRAALRAAAALEN